MPIRVSGPTLSLFIKNAIGSYSFVSAFIYGSQGAGKTTYGLKTLYHVYGSWDKALEHTYFFIDDLLPKLRDHFERGERIPAVLLDDAGVWLIKYHWRTDFNVWFSKLFNLMRTVVAGVIFTSVEATDIVKFVRDKVMYRVHVIRKAPKEAEAIGYRVFMTPLLEPMVKRVFADRVRLELPDYVRASYEKKRRDAMKRLFEELSPKKGEITKLTKEEAEKELEELFKSLEM